MRQSAFKLCQIFFLIGISAVVRVALPLLLQSFETRQDEALSVRSKSLELYLMQEVDILKFEDGAICACKFSNP